MHENKKKHKRQRLNRIYSYIGLGKTILKEIFIIFKYVSMLLYGQCDIWELSNLLSQTICISLKLLDRFSVLLHKQAETFVMAEAKEVG